MKRITFLAMLVVMLTNVWVPAFSDNPVLSGTHGSYSWVDLGTSVQWATCNVGATNPQDKGGQFSWGETSTKNRYYISDYKYYEYVVKDACMSRYCTCKSGYCTGCDDLTRLVLGDDAASVNMTGSWRMPTGAELQELYENCYWEWTDNYMDTGVKGFVTDQASAKIADGVTFRGTLVPYAVEAGDKGIIFVGNGGELNWPEVDGKIKGFRCYFEVKLGNGSPFTQGMRSFLVEDNDDENDTTTDINKSKSSVGSKVQKLIEEGKVVIIYDGVKYDTYGKKIIEEE